MSTTRSAPRVSRLVLRSFLASTSDAREALRAAAAGLRREAEFLVCPGGFIEGTWPQSWRGHRAWESRSGDVSALQPAALAAVRELLPDALQRSLRKRARWLTLGVDLYKDDHWGSQDTHAELVAVVDLDNGEVVRWTAKSYPTHVQERTLVREPETKSHLLEIGGYRVLVLGCHDLNLFSARGWASQREDGPRRAACIAMREAATRFAPDVVLQHPHTTDTPGIWRLGWAGVKAQLPTVRAWASGILYANRDGPQRASLDTVLSSTRGGEGEDFVV